MLRRIAGLAAAVLFCVSAQAQTADECIAEYEGRRAQFEATSLDVPIDCVQEGHIIALDAEADVNALPSACLGLRGQGIETPTGVEDHWHLKAKAILGSDPACIVQLLGFTGDALLAHPTCGTEEKRIDLPADEGAKWRNYLREQCPKNEE